MISVGGGVKIILGRTLTFCGVARHGLVHGVYSVFFGVGGVSGGGELASNASHFLHGAEGN